MPYSTACNTPLSNFEAGQNYQDVADPEVIHTATMCKYHSQQHMLLSPCCRSTTRRMARATLLSFSPRHPAQYPRQSYSATLSPSPSPPPSCLMPNPNPTCNHKHLSHLTLTNGDQTYPPPAGCGLIPSRRGPQHQHGCLDHHPMDPPIQPGTLRQPKIHIQEAPEQGL